MSQHHRNQQWSTHSPKLRKLIEPQLPLRCVNCPHPVERGEKFQVGHRRDAALGGKPTPANTGPVHAFCRHCGRACNQHAGGKLGARVTNSKRRRSQDIRPW